MTKDEGKRLAQVVDFLEALGLSVPNPAMVAQALVHRSYAAENGGIPDNERLEFLGDAVLGALAARFLFDTFPADNEGLLSKKKSFIVSREELGRRAETIGVAPLVLLGRGEDSTGGRQRSSILGSALEALVGALFLQIPLDFIDGFVRSHVLEPTLAALVEDAHLDAKSRLQEYVQSLGGDVPEYRKTGETGPPHERVFSVEVYVGGKCVGVGVGRRIKSAEDRAARAALACLLEGESLDTGNAVL